MEDKPQDPERGPEADSDRLRDLLLFLPRFGKLLAYLIADAGVSAGDKVLLGAAVVYLASPIDIVPDFIPVLGQVDDIYLVALCLLRLLNHSGESKLRQYWDGPEDIVALLHRVTDLATRYLPRPVREYLHEWVASRSPGPPADGAA